jgi:hypothetical protein
MSEEDKNQTSPARTDLTFTEEAHVRNAFSAIEASNDRFTIHHIKSLQKSQLTNTCVGCKHWIPHSYSPHELIDGGVFWSGTCSKEENMVLGALGEPESEDYCLLWESAGNESEIRDKIKELKGRTITASLTERERQEFDRRIAMKAESQSKPKATCWFDGILSFFTRHPS